MELANRWTEPNTPEALLKLLHDFAQKRPNDAGTTRRVIDLVTSAPRAAYRDNFIPGHLTGSAWVIDPRSRCVLLLHHTKLDRWLQPGGHADGEYDLASVALREAREESGLSTLHVAHREIFDIDIHTIPARGNEPEHLHFDARFVVFGDSSESPIISEESRAAAWVELSNIRALTSDDSVIRMSSLVTPL